MPAGLVFRDAFIRSTQEARNFTWLPSQSILLDLQQASGVTLSLHIHSWSKHRLHASCPRHREHRLAVLRRTKCRDHWCMFLGPSF